MTPRKTKRTKAISLIETLAATALAMALLLMSWQVGRLLWFKVRNAHQLDYMKDMRDINGVPVFLDQFTR